MADNKKPRYRPLPPWGETVFAVLVAVVLGSAMFGAVWTRIEEFETGKWDGPAIVQTIVLGLFLIFTVAGLWKYLSKRVRE